MNDAFRTRFFYQGVLYDITDQRMGLFITLSVTKTHENYFI